MIGKIIGFTLLLFILTFGVGPGNAIMLIDIPSLQLVLGLTLAGLFIAFDLSTIMLCSQVLRGTLKLKSKEEYEDHIHFWELASRLSLGGGAAGALVGLILMLANFSDVESIGPNMAVALISAFYGIMFSEFLFQPFKRVVIGRLKSANFEHDDEYSKRTIASWAGLLLGVTFPLVIFLVVLLSMSTLPTAIETVEDQSDSASQQQNVKE